MVEIRRSSIEKFLGPFAEDYGNVKVSLFIVSKSDPRLKQINLKELTPEQRAAKLRKWSEEFRFVAVIERGDLVFAHTHSMHVEKLKGVEELSLNKKKVTLVALTEEESQQLSVLGETLEEHLLQEIAEEKKSEKKESQEVSVHRLRQQDLDKNQVARAPRFTFGLIIQKVKNHLSQVLLNCIERFNEARREEAKQQAAEEKYFDIRRNAIKKDILKSEIQKGEIQKKEQTHQINQ